MTHFLMSGTRRSQSLISKKKKKEKSRLNPNPNQIADHYDIITTRKALGFLGCVFFQKPKCRNSICTNVCVWVCACVSVLGHQPVFSCVIENEALDSVFWLVFGVFQGHRTWEFQSREAVEAGENRRKRRWCKSTLDLKHKSRLCVSSLPTTFCRGAADFTVCLSGRARARACVCVCA